MWVTSALFLVGLAGSAAAIPDDQAPGQKGRRDKALADLDKEVAKLVKLVTNVDKMAPCTTPTTAAAPARGRRPKLRLGGKPFCPDAYAPIKKKLQDLVNEVSSNSGSDDRAGAVLSFWPQFIVSFETQLGTLSDMKTNHKSALTTGQQCKATGDAMISRGKTALVNKSLDEFDEARTAASKDQTNVTSWVSSQESMKSSMEQWERNTRLFEPSGKYDKAWKPVYKAMHASSKKMLDQWNTDWTTASKLCAEPAKGENHADLKKLEDQLYETLKKELDADMEKWRTAAKSMYQYDCDSMKKLYDYYCTKRDGDGEVILDEFEADDGVDEVDDSFPVDGDSEDVQYDATADKMKEDMKQKQFAAWTELGAMKSRAGALGARRNGRMATVEAYVAWRDGMETWVDDQVAPEEKAMEAVIAKGIYQGSRNPYIQLWKNFGIQQHDALEKQDKFACTLADESYCRYRRKSDGKCMRYTRPDCVSVTQCKIWEFKPVNGKDRGEKQVARYKRLLEKHYNFALDLFRQDNMGSFDPVGGMSMLKALESGCAKGGKLTFDKEVYAYPKCGADLEYKCSSTAK